MGLADQPDTKHSVVIRKEGSYRDTTRPWSNRYHFEGDLPADDDAWSTLIDNIVASEKTCHTSALQYVEAIGYDAGQATVANKHGVSVYAKSLTEVGTLVKSAEDNFAPGDCAALIRWSTPARSSRNHPIYLFSYHHNAIIEGGTADSLSTEQKAALTAYAQDWIDGFSDGTIDRVRCGPHGAVAIGKRVDEFIRHRDFPN